jgi:hypothetical protein
MIALAFVGWLKARRDGYDSPNARRIRGGARLVGYTGALATASCVFFVANARAEVHEQALQAGRDMAKFSDVMHDVNKLTINGENMFVSTGAVDGSTEAVLDRVEDHCRDGKSAFQDLANQVGPSDSAKVNLRPSGTIRAESGNEGTALCLAKGSLSGSSFLESASRFAETGDLGALGKLRYAYVAHDPKGDKAFVMLMWTEDSFKFRSLMPRDGSDSPGNDPTFAPRPKDAQRVMTAKAEGTPFAAYSYSSAQPFDAIVAQNDEALEGKGFQTVPDLFAAEDPAVKGEVHRMYEKNGVLVVLALSKEETGRTRVAIGESGVNPLSRQSRNASLPDH